MFPVLLFADVGFVQNVNFILRMIQLPPLRVATLSTRRHYSNFILPRIRDDVDCDGGNVVRTYYVGYSVRTIVSDECTDGTVTLEFEKSHV